MLIQAGAEVKALWKDRQSPLHAAAAKGFKNLTELLLAKGARPNTRDERNLTPMHSTLHSPEVLELLLKAGGNPNVEIYNADRTGTLTLVEYAQKHRPGIVDLLLKYGAKSQPLTDAAPPKE